jgi:hypothetical protein
MFSGFGNINKAAIMYALTASIEIGCIWPHWNCALKMTGIFTEIEE